MKLRGYPINEFLTRRQFGVFALPQAPKIFYASDQPRQNIQELDIQFARQIGIRPVEKLGRQWRPDHAAIGRYDLQFADDLPLVMTEKDAVKCRTLAGANRWYVPVDVALDESDREQLMHGLLEKIGHRPAKRS
jgi:hypothetical protein